MVGITIQIGATGGEILYIGGLLKTLDKYGTENI